MQNAKKWEEIAFFGTSDWKFPIKAPFFYLGAFPADPPNYFSPTWFCDFHAPAHQNSAFKNLGILGCFFPAGVWSIAPSR